MLQANDLGYATARIRVPWGKLDHLKPGVNLGALAGNSAGIPLVLSKPHFPKFPNLGFMCLVHEPENARFQYENESFSSCFRSFNGLVMAASDF